MSDPLATLLTSMSAGDEGVRLAVAFEDGGISFTIDGEPVAVGLAKFLRSCGVVYPQPSVTSKPGESVPATGGQLAAGVLRVGMDPSKGSDWSAEVSVCRGHGYVNCPTCALRSTPATPATETPTEQPAPSDGSAVVPLDVERLARALVTVAMAEDDLTWPDGYEPGVIVAISLIGPPDEWARKILATLGDKPEADHE